MRILLSLLALLFSAGAAFAQPVTLRNEIVAQGPAITWSDVFDGAGDAGAQAFALSPTPGNTQAISATWLAERAAASGLDWTPPRGVTQVFVTRGAIGRAAASQSNGASVMRARAGAQEVAVRRGETILVRYQTSGVQLTVRARSLQDGAVGETIRVINPNSEREIEAVVTGDGAARVL